MLWGSRRAPAIEQYACARLHVCVCVFAYACATGIVREEGIKMGLSRTLGVSQAVVDLQRRRPPESLFPKTSGETPP